MPNPIVGGYGSPQAIGDVLDVTATNQTRAEGHHKIGTRGYLPDGRVFYYASNGAVALTVGGVVIGSALSRSGNHDKITLTASATNFAAGLSDVTFDATDLDTSDIIENEYAEGYLGFEQPDGAAHGHTYKIRGHDSFDASGTATGTISLYDPIIVGADTSDEITLARNPWDRVIASTTAEEELVVGVAPRAVAASTALATDVTTTVAATTTRFFWAQTWGPCMVEMTSTSTVLGSAVMSSATADSLTFAALATHAATATTVLGLERKVYGVGMVPAVDEAQDFSMVFLMISP
jgi:hypothetical protein